MTLIHGCRLAVPPFNVSANSMGASSAQMMPLPNREWIPVLRLDAAWKGGRVHGAGKAWLQYRQAHMLRPNFGKSTLTPPLSRLTRSVLIPLRHPKSDGSAICAHNGLSRREPWRPIPLGSMGIDALKSTMPWATLASCTTTKPGWRSTSVAPVSVLPLIVHAACFPPAAEDLLARQTSRRL